MVSVAVLNQNPKEDRERFKKIIYSIINDQNLLSILSHF